MTLYTSEQQHALAAASPDRMFINGVCSDDVGLYVDTPPMPPMAEEKMEFTETPYANGDQYGRTGLFSDITLTVRCFVFDGGYHPSKIYGFLSGAKTLSFGNSQEYFYKIKKVVGIVPQYQELGKNFLNVEFVCAPFRYRVQNNPITYTESPARILNPTNVYHEPIYRVYIPEHSGMSVGQLIVNGIVVSMTGIAIATGVIIIDTERKKVYSDDNGTLTLVQQYTAGKFWDMILNPGENTVAWNGLIESVTITPNVRWL